MKYSANFHRNDELNGNAIASGDTLVVDIEGVPHASGAVYHEGFPIIADFDDMADGKVQLKFKLLERVNGAYQGLAKGTYVLKVRSGYGDGVNDEFFID